MIRDLEITMTPEEKTVLSILQSHKGKAAAIPKSALARAAGFDERRCRKIVKALIEIHNIPIGSDYGSDGGGYFLADSPEEMNAVYRRLRKHGISILVRAAAIRGITLQRLMRGIQQELF